MKAIFFGVFPSQASWLCRGAAAGGDVRPGAHSATAGRVATYTNTTIRSATTASVGSTTVVICCRASCMACFRSFLSLDVSFLGFPLSCRIFLGEAVKPRPQRALKEGPHSSGQGAGPPVEKTIIKNEWGER